MGFLFGGTVFGCRSPERLPPRSGPVLPKSRQPGDKSVSHGNQIELELDDGVEIPDGQRWVKIYEPLKDQFRNKIEQAIFWDLIVRAQWRAGTVRFRGHRLNLARGETVLSIRAYADEWGIGYKQMRLTLERFQDQGRIRMARTGKRNWVKVGHQKGAVRGEIGTLISITNYDTYQAPTKKKGAGQGARRAQVGRIEQDSKESKNQPTAPNGAPTDEESGKDEEERIWSETYATAREVLGHERAAGQFVTRAKKAGMGADEIHDLLSSADKATKPIAYCYAGLQHFRDGETNRDRWGKTTAESQLRRQTSGESLRPVGLSEVYIDGKWRPLSEIDK